MNLYDRFILPRVVHFTCSRNPNMRQRAKVVPAASGKVLEVGFGSGLNLPFYDSAMVRHLWALDPSQEMWALAQQKARRAPFPVEFLKASAEDVPLADGSVDTVVITYTLCTVADVPRALAQVARVLRADGRLLFCEHGLKRGAEVYEVSKVSTRGLPCLQRFGFLDESRWDADLPTVPSARPGSRDMTAPFGGIVWRKEAATGALCPSRVER